MNKLHTFSAIAGAAMLMSGIIAAFQLLPEASAARNENSCRGGIVQACVATDDILRNARVGVGVCAQVLSEDPRCTQSVE